MEGLAAKMVICLVGYGRIGRITARILAEKGFPPIVYDSSRYRVELARRDGFESHLADSTNPHVASHIASSCEAILTALPGRIAERVITLLVEYKAPLIVDVSFVRDPLAFHSRALENRIKLFVDAGFAPGLSNMLVAHGARGLDSAVEAIVYVGGISAEAEREPLGLVASWSTMDLLEEYSRPARAKLRGRLVELDPIDDAVEVELPGLGRFDAMPTDGLRTLLTSYPSIETLVEYTLRYPGHVNVLKTLKRLGLLDNKPHVIAGCSVAPRELLARLLEEILPKQDDRIVLHVTVKGIANNKRVERVYTIDVKQRDLDIDYPVLAYATSIVHAWTAMQALRGWGHPGVNTPEELAPALRDLARELSSRGIQLRRRECIES
ncbi:saccharopine dehydrogenase family protein [Hyperthermus butylicus]|uniref:Amino acid dehydrogenase n=1 Tax=Hyperthermus butylicus (strain DSM 5456 / JCM 9403 / PLM1-5) TaxID=415426 RepID=A2BJ17_HYPBU|nr:saccharopine dehydrogenase C-terminal domain-containing protein [Hyperthermus butylicus]ABM79978.1 putative Amino acid dehydrogenase [Hyperthermus butylicus DSM 5456]